MDIREEQEKKRNKFLQTGIGVVSILGGITGSIPLIIGGIYILPQISDKIQSKFKYSNKVKWGIYVVLFIIAIILNYFFPMAKLGYVAFK